MPEGSQAGFLASARRIRTVRLLTQGQFAIYVAGNGLSLIGSWMQRIACGWLVWEWTQSGFWLGVLAAADLLPIMVVGPFAGVAADRLDRLRLNRVCQTILATLAALMAALLFLDMLTLASLLLLVTLQGCLVAVTQPARLAMVQELVAREDVPSAVALNSVNVNMARLTGPAIAGILIVSADIGWVFVVNAVVTAIFVCALGVIRLSDRDRPPIAGNIWAQLFDGFRYVATTPHLKIMLLLMFSGGALVRSIWELTPAFAAQSFAVTATGLAVLSAAMAVGAMGAGLTIGPVPAARLLVTVPVTWGLGALAIVVLGFSTSPWPAVLSATVMGAFVMRSVISTQTFVQLTAPDRMRGRALSVHGLISRGSPSLGALAIGYASDRIGLAWSVLASALVMIAITAATMPAVRRLAARLDENDPPTDR